MQIIEKFEIPFYQYLNAQGEIADSKAALLQDQRALQALYRLMVLVRMMDNKAIALQRTGKLGTYPSTRGQEAVFVGLGFALEKKDIFVPYYRDLGTLIQRGVRLAQILLYWGGDERGNAFYAQSRDFPFSVPVGSQPLHAAGAAFALKYHKEQAAVLSVCGDGATSQGDFYEALNIAGIWKLPVVFVICNNQWAISVARGAQTAAATLAQKAIAAGIPGEQVDGNDIIAVVERTKAALSLAREKQKACVLEMLCYRQHDHTTADDATRYEPAHLREQEWKKEPINRLKTYLENLKWWDANQEEALLSECATEVDAAVKEYLSYAEPPLTDMFDYLYASLPTIYEEQRMMLSTLKGKDAHG